ncbi:hypothetical protein B0A48_07771 [Cryoendolithus antarcticus]|uniref:non-specific serine/threonine protein kinase n=1 Tax=Cryoendolithus antarcticus TaxID=1507870 RepID=A0A1V8T7G6_9PEZI|nr:hypothetical protein B0A48_07771 [Cryoendolithus antarcticus]
MSSTLDDEDLSLSISAASARRNSRDNRDTNGRAPNPTVEALRNGPEATKAPSPHFSARLSQYTMIKTLGEGSFGKVKLAIHQSSGQQVALKIISRRKLVTRDMAGRIEREIQYLQLLRHPHIIKLFTVITTPGEIVMVLEYAGGELFDYIVQHGKMAEEKARKFFQQIVCAVEYCHRHKIVHRDLKPENLLLDSDLNVKIADFGLSNIMTDGNFLKTSCGSPNYAAPEVISGKLYAGPEVDVWSCGVILYVLLCGRLPFDDEYIPALFKKIAQGQYVTPNYLSSGAKKLISRMLQVSPVHRITVQEIRQDPWFTKDLAEYLQPPVEEFEDTGIDPTKAIDPNELAKGQPLVVKEKLHASVVGKLGKTMGYAPSDVQEALAKDEPSTIKDAYLIIRENQLMKTNPSLAADQPGFIAQSPPAFLPDVAMSPRPGSSSRPLASPHDHPRHGSTSSAVEPPRAPASTIGVLPSSLTEYHLAYMRGQINKTSSPTHMEDQRTGDLDRPRTKEEQEATAKRLKPHSKSSANLHRHAEKPEPMTSMPEKTAKKPRTTKWQFGIRSRNSPAEAMLAIYKALQKMGAEWEVPVAKQVGTSHSSEASPDRSRPEESPEYSDSDPDAGTDPEYATHSQQELRRQRRDERDGQPAERRGRERYGRWNDWGYSIPEDPWCLNARFLKEGMFAPGVVHPTSTHPSQVDLKTGETRRHSLTGLSALASQSGTSDNAAATGPPSGNIATNGTPSSGDVAAAGAGAPGATADGTVKPEGEKTEVPLPRAEEKCYVYVTVQLYAIEKDFYLVDFKCAGYEQLVRKLAKAINGGVAPDMQKHAEGRDNHDDNHVGYSAYEKDKAAKANKKDKKDDVVKEVRVFREKKQPKPKKDDKDEKDGKDGKDDKDVKDDEEDDESKDGDDDDDDDDDGYEDVEYTAEGRNADEKDITSPYPFLDVASRLIIQLAAAEE